MKRRYILAKPPREGTGLLDAHGIGAPRTVPGGTPVHPVLPGQPGFPDPTAGATKAIGDALGSSIQKAVAQLLPAGEVLLGAVLLVVGLLLATGQMGNVGRAGVFVASRGVIK